jgi:hypothetical protein
MKTSKRIVNAARYQSAIYNLPVSISASASTRAQQSLAISAFRYKNTHINYNDAIITLHKIHTRRPRASDAAAERAEAL